MKISVSCPVCRELVTCEFDGTLHGVISIEDLAIMELTTPAEISRHMDSHRTLSGAGTGFELDPRYWQQLRAKLEILAKSIPARLQQLNELGRGLPSDAQVPVRTGSGYQPYGDEPSGPGTG